ncbi:uncharacterized protein LOC127870329 isoform X2 [Dreissena polymorpha]|uniref:uncharacterized protein LOC127870329 isoform X2 n=1 Tax=Dreissena polymorpha TaxID=45954 RepID=UPI002264E350|nr:uncharacterized protein LOC127870329 isoform X2 [Dreissena polymorpha]
MAANDNSDRGLEYSDEQANSSPEIPCFDDWASTTSTQTGCSELYGGLSLRPLPEDAYACYRKASTTSVRDFVLNEPRCCHNYDSPTQMSAILNAVLFWKKQACVQTKKYYQECNNNI